VRACVCERESERLRERERERERERDGVRGSRLHVSGDEVAVRS
jgi:hypothetical protein